MIPRELIGLGSYSFRYAARRTDAPMDGMAFLEECSRLGLKRALLCENLNYSAADDSFIKALAETAARNGITVEVGMRGASEANIQRHIHIARMLGARLIRIVLGEISETPPDDTQRLKYDSLNAIKTLVPLLEEADLYIGIENHFDLAAADLRDIVSQINSKRVGLIFDSTNCLGLTEKPLDVLHMMKGHLLSVHLKDYQCRKTDGGYIFSGVDLGDGALDMAAVIQTARSFNPSASFIVEYNMKPSEAMSGEELLEWERERVLKNVSVIMGIGNSIEEA